MLALVFIIFICASISWFVLETRIIAIKIIQSSIKLLDKNYEVKISRNNFSKRELISCLRILSDKLPFNSLWLLISAFTGFAFGVITLTGFDLYRVSFFLYLFPAGAILAGGLAFVLFYFICKRFHILPSCNIVLNGLLGAIVMTCFVNIVPFKLEEGLSGLGNFLSYMDPANVPFSIGISDSLYYPPLFISYVVFLTQFLGAWLAGIISILSIKDLPYDKENKKFLDRILILEKYIIDDYTNSQILSKLDNLIKNNKYIDCARALKSTDVCDKESARSIISITLSKSPVSDLHHIDFEVSEGEIEKNDNNTEEINFKVVSDKSHKSYFNTSEDLNI